MNIEMEFTETNDFNRKNCYYSSLFARAIYDLDELRLLAKDFGMSCKIFEVKNHRAAIVQNWRFAVMVYCGTNDKPDIWTDMQYFQRQISGTSALVHIGVDDAHNLLALKMDGELKKIWVSGKNWIVTGHSLGGGLAVRRLVALRNPNGHCYTFGAMRCGNAAMFTAINTSITRVVNGEDIVPHLPFKKMIISGCEYDHRQNNLISLNYDGTIIDGKRSLWGEIKEKMSGIVGDVYDSDVVPYMFEDHGIDEYIKVLAQWEGK